MAAQPSRCATLRLLLTTGLISLISSTAADAFVLGRHTTSTCSTPHRPESSSASCHDKIVGSRSAILPPRRQSQQLQQERCAGVMSRYGSSQSALFAKKKKKKSGGGGGGSSGGKVQVKMLKHVPGTGSVGDVVMVTPAFFNNKLRPSGSAERIDDETVAAERRAKDEERRAALDAAKSMQDKITDINLQLSMKAGPEGHLFGSVGHKTILTELRNQFPKGALGKRVKIVSVKDENDKEVTDHHGDIKDLGTFTVRVELLKDVEAKFAVTVNQA